MAFESNQSSFRFIRVHQHVIVLRPLQSLVGSQLELTVTSQPVTDLSQRAVIHILADVYVSVQVVDVDDNPDWSKECALRDAGVDGSPFRHDVSNLFSFYVVCVSAHVKRHPFMYTTGIVIWYSGG